jgi:hypothetical protein
MTRLGVKARVMRKIMEATAKTMVKGRIINLCTIS